MYVCACVRACVCVVCVCVCLESLLSVYVCLKNLLFTQLCTSMEFVSANFFCVVWNCLLRGQRDGNGLVRHNTGCMERRIMY